MDNYQTGQEAQFRAPAKTKGSRPNGGRTGRIGDEVQRDSIAPPRTKAGSRRRALKLGAAAAALPLVHIRTAGAAGKLKLALWEALVHFDNLTGW